MKVLHICITDSGGAGSCAYRIHKSMIANGIDSKMLVLNKTRTDASIVAPYKVRGFFYRAFHKLLRLCSLYVFEYDKLIKQSAQNSSLYTSPAGYIDISNNPLLKWADIIHVHWVDMFIDQPTLFNKVKKPIVWTLHDEGLFHGTSHYHDSVLNNDPLELKYRKVKFRMVQNANNLGVVLLSKYFMDSFGDLPILKNVKLTVINNSVDYNIFKPVDKIFARNNNNIPADAVVLVFIATSITNHYKGLNILIDSIKQLKSEKMIILAIGEDKDFIATPLVINKGKVNDPHKLSELISAADYFVMPSLQEAFSQAPLEAMACGKPAIVFPFSGTEELITETNGIRCNGFTAKDLASAINEAMHRKYDEKQIREFVINKFSPETITRQYVEFYRELLS